MAEHDPTRNDSSSHPLGPLGRSLRCEEWECLIADALDGTVPAADSAAFERHRQECAACAGLLEQAGRGVAWLRYLESEPEAPADLLAKILARTSGPGASAPATSTQVMPAAPPPLRGWYRTALPAARRMIEPRMWMTAAMAFFSIALTLNLIGLRLSEIRLTDLRPSQVLTNVSRQYYSTKEQGVKYYDNLRFVYEMESQVRDQVRELRRSEEPAAVPLPDDTQPQPSPSPSSRNGGPGRRARTPQGEGYNLAAGGQPGIPMQGIHNQGIHNRGTRTQAERSWA